ncbi:MAG TPA: alpha/beta hydrolase [Dokdonella sp.]|uniref:alpha/beta hydrolase n=1 Tax=Dokdonella sp. TaxID=2291710 RepID=UPI002B58C43D|nr:alpha/beta hydrolase [Dokdonella sp.]HUD40827.1 alpha/beta hydrolase [Dokdonella sp.]
MKHRLVHWLLASALAAAGTVAAAPPAARELAYGPDPRQRVDLYAPAGAARAPIVVLVHGGAWAFGDKRSPGIVGAKLAHWREAGWLVASVNYRLLPQADPLIQAGDVARAVAAVQRAAREAGGDPDRVVLVGHSAGAHLVALLGAAPARLAAAGARRPLGVVALDSAAMDVVEMMELPRRPALYDRAFGRDRAFWTAASPYHQWTAEALPLLAVCSTRRPDACPQARALAARAAALGTHVTVRPEPLTHAAISRELGSRSAYTDAVDAFLRARFEAYRRD